MNGAQDLRRDLGDPSAVCEALGLVTKRTKRQPRGLTIECPAHGGLSCSVTIAADETIRVRCFGCDLAGDVFTLIAAAHGLAARNDFPEVLKIAAALAGRSQPDAHLRVRATTHTREGSPASASAKMSVLGSARYDEIATWLLDRCPLASQRDVVRYVRDQRDTYGDAEAVGIGALPRPGSAMRDLVNDLLATFRRDELEATGLLRAGRATLEWPAWRLLIPWRGRGGSIDVLQRRALGGEFPKYRFPPGRSPGAPFGAELFDDAARDGSAEVIVCEGALDALARRKIARRASAGERPIVLAVPSASTLFDAAVWAPFLAGRDVVLAFDSDAPGDQAARRFADRMCGGARRVVRERVDGAKDFGDVVAQHMEIFDE